MPPKKDTYEDTYSPITPRSIRHDSVIAEDGNTGFEVTQETVIGFVSYSDSGTHNPIQAAFLLIADTGNDGVFRFPGEHENSTIVVTVEGRN